MKFLPLLLLLIAVRTCTKESPGFVEQKVQVIEAVQPIPEDSVIVTISGPFADDLKTRGMLSSPNTKLRHPMMLEPEFSERFIYPEIALAEGIDGRCTVQFGLDSRSVIQFFSVLSTSSKLFSDEIRKAIMDKPISLRSFPSNEQYVRFEVTVDYKLRPAAPR